MLLHDGLRMAVLAAVMPNTYLFGVRDGGCPIAIPRAGMGEFFFNLAGRLIIDVMAYGTAKVVVPVLSLGSWRVDVRKAGTHWFTGWPFWRRGTDGRLYVGPDAAIFLGIGFWVVVVALVLHLSS